MSGSRDPTTAQSAHALAPAGLPPDILAEVPGRLVAAALGAATMFGLALLTEPLRPAAVADHHLAPISSAIGVLCSLAVAWVAHRRRLSDILVTDVAVVFQLAIGAIIWVQELAVPFATTTHTPGIPTAAAWLLLFPLLVPLPWRTAAMANLIVVLAGPVVLATYIAFGQPAPRPGHAALWFIAAALAGATSILASGVLRRALRGLDDAREHSRYELIRVLGRGGMGEVYVARHARLARLVAVKRIRPDRLPHASPARIARIQQRFELEARATAQLRSPHVVELYDYGVAEDGALYYAMELLDGIDLQELVARFGPQPPARVVHLLLQACDALADAHSHDLIHRDIKPANLMLCRLGVQYDVLKVLDFGTVKPSASGADAMSTRQGVFVGTPAYAAPEAAHGEAGPSSDLYALGAVAWWLLAGAGVFSASTPHEHLIAHQREAIPDLRAAVGRDLPEDLAALIVSLLAKRPDHRPPSARALAAALRAIDLPAWTQDDARAWWRSHDAAPASLTAPPTISRDPTFLLSE